MRERFFQMRLNTVERQKLATVEQALGLTASDVMRLALDRLYIREVDPQKEERANAK
jgi:hypothetical protein